MLIENIYIYIYIEISLRMYRSLGGHSAWFVAFTMAISKSFHTNNKHQRRKKSHKRQRIQISMRYSRQWSRKDLKKTKQNASKSDLEIAVDFGEADFGGILEGSIGLPPALERPHLLTKAKTLTLTLALVSLLLSLPTPSLFLSSFGRRRRRTEKKKERKTKKKEKETLLRAIACVWFCSVLFKKLEREEY